MPLVGPAAGARVKTEFRGRVALTIDDGPNPGTTEALLNVLGHYQMRANFFVLGRQVERHPDLARLMAAAGHGLYSHGYDHLHFSALNPVTIRLQLQRTEALLEQVRPTPSPYPLRLPYNDGIDASMVRDAVKGWRSDAVLVQWDLSAGEWTLVNDCASPVKIMAVCIEAVQGLTDADWTDGIILAHDWPVEQEASDRWSPMAPTFCATLVEQFILAIKAKNLDAVLLEDVVPSGQAVCDIRRSA